ncbi:O-antigen ligase [Seinonella peptonophila]|uniref:O-antigen ligase n=1 Tax=Seinonella peptonophila TaxID=112248 RepID=A0A1M4ZIX7_9BACL|nr:O-antigen ligase family protein [Seinonella peptonophila]SHF17516.1 O-antigen ligase [Seinonella peptonophila]
MKLELNRSIIVGLTQLLYFSILLTPFLPPVALVCIGMLTFFHFKGKWNIKGWPERIFIGFALLSCISWYFNPSWFDNGIPIGLISVSMFVLYFLLTVWIRQVVQWSWEEVQQMYIRFWLGGLFVAAIVIIQQVDWPVINENTFLKHLLDFYSHYRWQSENSVRSVGTAGNSNLAAAMLICFALMSIYASSVLQKMWQKVAAFGALAVFCIAIWSTGSRGAWVGLVIGLIVQVWMTGHRKRTVALTCLLIVAVIFYPDLIPRNDTLMSTFFVRFKVWSTAFEIFREHWLVGVLPLHFGQLFLEKAGFYVFHAHNVILGVASEFGIIGLMLFVALVLMTIRRARHWRKAAETKEEKRLAGMLISQTIALLGHGMYDYPIISPQVGLIFMLSVIIIHTQSDRISKELSLPESKEIQDFPAIDYKWVSSLFIFLREFWKIKRL